MNFQKLIDTFDKTHKALQDKANKAINQTLTIRNWLFGFYIVEFEQKGTDRADYGAKLFSELAIQLKKKKLSATSTTNLRLYRQFYTTYPSIGNFIAERIEPSILGIGKSFQKKGMEQEGLEAKLLISNLSFSHFVELIKVDKPIKRLFYEVECIKGNWAVKELKRQIGSLLYERTGLSKDKKKLIAQVHQKSQPMTFEDFRRDPYIFDFLGYKQQDLVLESDLESALIHHLQSFLLELGRGFCFEARQKRITINNEHYFVDLLFYNRILKCHVLIDLKTREFSHLDAGQMNFYLNYFKDNEMLKGDNPPVGIVLCSHKDAAVAKYATANIDNQLFVSKYMLELPTEEELLQFLKKEQEILEQLKRIR